MLPQACVTMNLWDRCKDIRRMLLAILAGREGELAP
jgi:hypothetical protein